MPNVIFNKETCLLSLEDITDIMQINGNPFVLGYLFLINCSSAVGL